MGFVATLLDKYKTATRTPSDNAVADAFNVSRQTVSQWRSGLAYPKDEKVIELAAGAKEDPNPWLVALQAERATGPAATAWKKLARSLGVAASMLIAAYTAIHPNVCDARLTANNSQFDISGPEYTFHTLISQSRLRAPPRSRLQASDPLQSSGRPASSYQHQGPKQAKPGTSISPMLPTEPTDVA